MIAEYCYLFESRGQALEALPDEIPAGTDVAFIPAPAIEWDEEGNAVAWRDGCRVDVITRSPDAFEHLSEFEVTPANRIHGWQGD